jgi:hypothetical protein
MTREELCALGRAKRLLESPNATVRMVSLAGKPIERLMALAPRAVAGGIQAIARAVVRRALGLAVASLRERAGAAPSDRLHRVMVGCSGALGGAFGFPALVFELPTSTTLMLRSIADIARSEGHDLRDVGTRLACLEVFALGGRGAADDGAEHGYWLVRAGLAHAVAEAAAYVGQRGLVDIGAPALVRLVGAIAGRFGVILTEQAAAKAVPIAGAVAGMAINVLFMTHFQQMARGHFIVRRLEAKYGQETVRAAYEAE